MIAIQWDRLSTQIPIWVRSSRNGVNFIVSMVAHEPSVRYATFLLHSCMWNVILGRDVRLRTLTDLRRSAVQHCTIYPSVLREWRRVVGNQMILGKDRFDCPVEDSLDCWVGTCLLSITYAPLCTRDDMDLERVEPLVYIAVWVAH